MGVEINIRDAHRDDVGAMAGLLGELFFIEDDFNIDIEKQKRGLELLLKTDNCLVLVAEISVLAAIAEFNGEPPSPPIVASFPNFAAPSAIFNGVSVV